MKLAYLTLIIKKVLSVAYWVLLGALVAVAGSSAISAIGLPGYTRMFIVQSGSMSPAIRPGSLVLAREHKIYDIGDIITYAAEAGANIKNPKNTITHRIVSIEDRDGTTYYTTKGDANNIEDFKQPYKELVLGRVFLSIPLLGYPVSYAKTQWGFILLIIIPATIIVYNEMMFLKKEAQRLMRERKKRKLTKKEEIEEKIGEEILAVEKKIKKEAKKIRKPRKKSKKKNAKSKK